LGAIAYVHMSAAEVDRLQSAVRAEQATIAFVAEFTGVVGRVIAPPPDSRNGVYSPLSTMYMARSARRQL